MKKKLSNCTTASKNKENTKKPPPSRNNEKRKERSRDAARCRRSREVEIFSDLSSALPLTAEQVAQLDKASIMRLAIAYLKVRCMITLVPELERIEKTSKTDSETLFLKSIDGFLLVLSVDGDFVYVSENIADYLGITQIDLMGQNILEYSHPCDHDEIKEMLSTKDEHADAKSYFLRLKCTLTSKGRSVNLKSATYKVIHCTGHMLHANANQHCMVSIGQPIPHPSNIETPLPYETFFTKHSLDMKFTYADEKMMDFLGFTPDELLGTSAYAYYHAADTQIISSAFKSLFAKGQCETNRYRFLAKDGGYVWVLTQATLIYDKVQKPESVVCVNFLISGVECKEDVYTTFQLEASSSKQQPLEVSVAEEVIDGATQDQPLLITTTKDLKITDLDEADSKFVPRPQTATSTIFAPRTEEMSKGFLTFSDEEPGLTLLKDEPDDLTHLAPVAGDVVSLDAHPYLSDMMLDDFFLKEDDAFCPLPSPTHLLQNSECSLGSSSPPQSEDEQMSAFVAFPQHDDDEEEEEDGELTMKAPYISMAMGDDLPLLNSDDLMWSNGVPALSPTQINHSPPANTSNLLDLLSSGVNKDTLWYADQQLHSPVVASGSIKRNCQAGYNNASKRIKSEQRKELMSSELLQQLLTNGGGGRCSIGGRNKNWQRDSGGGGGRQRKTATSVSQPSESVLMNLLDSVNVDRRELDADNRQLRHLLKPEKARNTTLISLLDPDALGILPSLADLTQQDYEVNAPVSNCLLQGEELITALNNNNNDALISNGVI